VDKRPDRHSAPAERHQVRARPEGGRQYWPCLQAGERLQDQPNASAIRARVVPKARLRR